MRMLRRLLSVLLPALLWMLAAAAPAHAHQVGLTYISVADTNGQQTAVFKLAFRDLEVASGIDHDMDGKITWGEAKASLESVATYVATRTSIDAGGPCTLTRQSAEPMRINGEGYLSLTFGLACPDFATAPAVQRTVFLEVDPTSKILVNVQSVQGVRTFVLGSSEAARPVVPAEVEQKAPSDAHDGSLISYFLEGVSHLFGGPDHMLFLLVLIIPAVFAGGGLKGVAIAVLLPITGFTLGHALTLTSAASGLVRPPAQLVEILIAVTILLTAADNVRRFIPGPRSGVAFLFGLIHGFGFASALGALDLDGWSMAAALLGFNLGIEAGQAVLALAVAPILYLVRDPARRLYILPLGVSILAGAMAIFWIAERTGLVG